MPRFLHAADLHLDSPLRRLELHDEAPVSEIRAATRRALENLVDTAIEYAVDFVVIAGDLYDGDWRDQQTGLCFANQAARLIAAGIPLYVIHGNHDAASVITRSITLPRNPDGSAITLGSRSAESVRLEQAGVAIHGRSFGRRSETENFALGYPAPDHDMFNVGLLHTSLTGAEGHDSYAPCTPQQLCDLGYQYWALGHIHQRGEHHPEGGPPIVFPGNVQGRHVRETGPKGCVLVTYEGRRVESMEFVPLDVVRWEVCHQSITEHPDVESLLGAVTDWLEAQCAQSEPRLLVARVRLHGAGTLHSELLRRHDYYESVLRQRAFEVGGDRLWLEGLRLRTAAAQGETEEIEAGPLAAVGEVLESMAGQDWVAGVLQDELAALRKLGTETSFLSEGDRLLDEARALLMERLGGSADG
jgi:DNA repair exonuclease SbcCD nuclease subunit